MSSVMDLATFLVIPEMEILHLNYWDSHRVKRKEQDT
ncbi:hypothetical protein ACJ73_08136 [Blastomyces percursus]|uniref:Uncharacterized protein n=1 Tax=Blastomyces percursus TaxID=1658174 RepID=A0A1J9PX96_9EURO|nr:hypothetical protein ACJ73_08136 [Blastomyces percursus]